MSANAERKEMEYYLGLYYPVTLTEDKDGRFSAEIEELPGCVTQADTLSEVYAAVEEAKKLWIETAYADGHEIPLPRYLKEYTGKFLVRIPKSLHRSLVNLAKKEGVSLNQYVSTLLVAGVTRNIIDPEMSAATQSNAAKAFTGEFIPYGTKEKTISRDSLPPAIPSSVPSKKEE